MPFPLFWRWLAAALAIFATPWLVPGITIDGFPAAATMALVLGVLNLLVKPLLVMLTLPITVLTLGLFWLVINALIFQWAGHLVEGVHVATFGSALLASLFVSVVSSAAHALIRRGAPGRPRIRFVWRRGGTPPGERREERRVEHRDGETIELHESEKGKWE